MKICCNSYQALLGIIMPLSSFQQEFSRNLIIDSD